MLILEGTLSECWQVLGGAHPVLYQFNPALHTSQQGEGICNKQGVKVPTGTKVDIEAQKR